MFLLVYFSVITTFSRNVVSVDSVRSRSSSHPENLSELGNINVGLSPLFYILNLLFNMYCKSDSPLIFVLELPHRVCLAFASHPIRISSPLLSSVSFLTGQIARPCRGPCRLKTKRNYFSFAPPLLLLCLLCYN